MLPPWVRTRFSAQGFETQLVIRGKDAALVAAAKAAVEAMVVQVRAARGGKTS